MKFHLKTAGLLLIGTGAIAVVAYVLDAQHGKRLPAPNAMPRTAPAPATNPVPHPRLPASHPPIAEPSPQPRAREGKVQVDPTRAFTHFRVGNNSVRAIFPDGTLMWLGTTGGIVRHDTASHEFKTYDTSNGLLSNGVFHLGKLRGKISVGTYGGGLSLFDQKAQTWEHYSIPEGLGDAIVYDVLEAANGDVWIATGSGVNRVRDGALKERAKWDLYTVESTAGGLPSNRVFTLAQSKDGGVWCATGGGVAKFHNGKWSSWTRATGLGRPRAGVGHDVSTGTAPSRQAGPTRKTSETGAEQSGHITALKVGAQGEVWAGIRGAGLARFDGKGWTNYTVAEGLPSNRIYALHIDHGGQLWIGTDTGLALFKDGRFQLMTTAHGLLPGAVYSIMTAKDGAIWVGGFGGVAHIRRSALN